jgi:hypothetical protein
LDIRQDDNLSEADIAQDVRQIQCPFIALPIRIEALVYFSPDIYMSLIQRPFNIHRFNFISLPSKQDHLARPSELDLGFLGGLSKRLTKPS